jgi:hypothetical protein
MTLHIVHIAAGLRMRVPRAELLKRLPADPARLGEELARQAGAYAATHALGYYPPLEYLRSRQAVDAYLLDATEQVSAASAQYVEQQIIDKLAAVFSSVHVQSLQFTAFALPAVRMHQPDAFSALARHYVPDVVKCELLLSVIQKHKTEEGLQAFVKGALHRWLADEFAEFEVTSARLVAG